MPIHKDSQLKKCGLDAGASCAMPAAGLLSALAYAAISVKISETAILMIVTICSQPCCWLAHAGVTNAKVTVRLASAKEGDNSKAGQLKCALFILIAPLAVDKARHKSGAR